MQDSIVRAVRRRGPLLILGLIVLVAFLLRVYDLAGNPAGFFCDEASIQYDAYRVLHTGHDRWGVFMPFYFRSFGDFESPLFIYASMPFVALMGLNPVADRLVAALFATGTVALMYPLALELFRRRDVALLSAATLAVLPWHLLFSRVAFEAISMPFFYALAATLFFVGVRRRSSLPYLLSFLAWGLSLYTYHVPRLLTPLLFGSLLLIYYREVLARRRDSFIGLCIFAMCSIPLALSIRSGEATARFGLIGVFGAHKGWDLVATIAQYYAQHFSVLYLFAAGSHPGDAVLRNYIPGIGALYWVQLPLLLVGVAGLLARRGEILIATLPFLRLRVVAAILLGLSGAASLWIPNGGALVWLLEILAATVLVLPSDRAVLLLATWFLWYPLGGALTEGPTQLRVMFGVVPFSLVTAYGAAEAWRWIRGVGGSTVSRRFVAAAAVFVALVGVTASGARLWEQLYVQYPRATAGYWGWQGGPSAIIPYFVRVQRRYDQMYLSGTFNSPEIFIPYYAPAACVQCLGRSAVAAIVGPNAPTSCEQCKIGGLDRYDSRYRQLFALRPTPDEMPPTFRYIVHKTLYYGDGTVAFKIVEARRLR